MQGRVFSYARWSSDKQAEGDSLRRQISQAEQWCLRHGLSLAEERFVDSGISAFRGKNQAGELGCLMETLKARDNLLVEDAMDDEPAGQLGLVDGAFGENDRRRSGGSVRALSPNAFSFS